MPGACLPIGLPRVDSSKGCPLAHQGKLANISDFLYFSGPRKTLPGMAPNGAGRLFFGLIQTLPTFWATWILILRICILGICLGPKFLAWAQLGPGLGPAWAQLGPSLGPAWAHPLGPSWGPPTWAWPGLSHLDQQMLIFYCKY